MEVLLELMLDKEILDRPFEKCSGGEQKRIAIAQELMSLEKKKSSSLLFMFIDEPTSGLDSTAACEVMACLKKLATIHQMTVIVSIHVPSSDILQLFDKLYVLAKGGLCIYSNKPELIEKTLENKLSLKIPETRPPVECLIKIACNGKNVI